MTVSPTARPRAGAKRDGEMIASGSHSRAAANSPRGRACRVAPHTALLLFCQRMKTRWRPRLTPPLAVGQDCHFAGTASSSLLKRVVQGEGGAAE